MVVNSALILQSKCLSISALLLSTQVRYLKEAIISKCDDQATPVLKIGPCYEDWSNLSFGCPHKSDIFVDQEEVIERSKNGHEAGRLELHSVLSLHQHAILCALIILVYIGAVLIKVIC